MLYPRKGGSTTVCLEAWGRRVKLSMCKEVTLTSGDRDLTCAHAEGKSRASFLQSTHHYHDTVPNPTSLFIQPITSLTYSVTVS
jgi:hypothetical protein